MFQNNAIVNMTLNKYVEELIIDESSGLLWGAAHLNQLDRIQLAEEYTQMFLKNNDILIIGGEGKFEEFIRYVANQIDLKIPKFYFLECNKDIVIAFSMLLAIRIYQTKGKDGFSYTKHLKYKYNHDFSQETKFIEKTKATSKQIECLKDLGENNGFLLTREEFLSKAYATSLIEYLMGKKQREPLMFFYFFSIK